MGSGVSEYQVMRSEMKPRASLPLQTRPMAAAAPFRVPQRVPNPTTPGSRPVHHLGRYGGIGCAHHLGQLPDDGVEGPKGAPGVPGTVRQNVSLEPVVAELTGPLDVQPLFRIAEGMRGLGRCQFRTVFSPIPPARPTPAAAP